MEINNINSYIVFYELLAMQKGATDKKVPLSNIIHVVEVIQKALDEAISIRDKLLDGERRK